MMDSAEDEAAFMTILRNSEARVLDKLKTVEKKLISYTASSPGSDAIMRLGFRMILRYQRDLSRINWEIGGMAGSSGIRSVLVCSIDYRTKVPGCQFRYFIHDLVCELKNMRPQEALAVLDLVDRIPDWLDLLAAGTAPEVYPELTDADRSAADEIRARATAERLS